MGALAFVLANKYLNGLKILHILKLGFICLGEMDAVDTCCEREMEDREHLCQRL